MVVRVGAVSAGKLYWVPKDTVLPPVLSCFKINMYVAPGFILLGFTIVVEAEVSSNVCTLLLSQSGVIEAAEVTVCNSE